MKPMTVWLFLIVLFFVGCEDTTSNNNNTSTDDPPDTIIEDTPKDPPPVDTRQPLYLQGVYATSNGAMIDNIFDGDPSTIWTTQKGAGPDEGIMLYFQNNPSIGEVELESTTGAGMAKVDNWILYGNGVPLGEGQSGNIINVGRQLQALYIRVGNTNQESEVSVEAEDKKGLVMKFSKNHSVGLQNIIIRDDNGEEYRLIPPRKVNAKIIASSTLSPSLAYNTSKLFDARKEFAWVEGVDGYGDGEQLTFQLEEEVDIDEIQIWNGYQRSESHYKSNTRLKGFSVGETGGKMYEYTLRDDAAPQKIDLKVGLKNRNFELKINSFYRGRSYKDLAISEMLFFENGQPLQLNVMDNTAESAIVQKSKGTILESMLDTRIANNMEYPVSGFFAERSIILRSDGTFVMYLLETDTSVDELDAVDFVSIADGNWEIISADGGEAKIKIFGKVLDASAVEAYYAGMNDQAELTRIFKDNLTITTDLIRGEKVLDEIVVR